MTAYHPNVAYLGTGGRDPSRRISKHHARAAAIETDRHRAQITL